MMTTEVTNKAVLYNQCPRCGGMKTKFAERDGNIETWICLDCQAKDPHGEGDGYSYDLIHVPLLTGVEWWTQNYTVRHEITDSDYLATKAALRLFDVLAEFVQDVDAVGVDALACDWPDLAVTYRKAKAVMAQAKPSQGEKGA